MKGKKIIILLTALILPVLLFLFLKRFGRNEFNVPALFADNLPAITSACEQDYKLPYVIDKNLLEEDGVIIDSLACVSFLGPESAVRLSRVKDVYAKDPLKFFSVESAEKRSCVYLLQEPFDVALVDSKGRIRGQYESSDRDEIDRLITEIAIILKKY